MATATISQLKVNPSSVILKASELPVAIKKRSEVEAYLIGKELYENIVSFIENYIDAATVEKTDFSKSKDFEKVAQELGI
jgi:PHD/YefM family antitoxin component YafN of YafNO toxin-antitoxin module